MGKGTNLVDYMANSVVKAQRAKDDCMSNASVISIDNTDGWVNYTNNGLAYRDYNDGKKWDEITDTLDVSNEADDADIKVVLKTLTSSNNNNTLLHVQMYIPDPAGDIYVMGRTLYIRKVNNPHVDSLDFDAYAGEKAKLYGFKFKTKVDDVLSGTVNLSERSILIKI